MQIVISHARDGAIHDIIASLEKGPPGRQPPEDKVELHQWFQQLDEQDQSYIHQIITEAVDAVLFSTFVILDGAAGGPPIPEKPSDFALYLQVYDDEEMGLKDSPQIRIRLNPWQGTDDLHDIFSWAIEDRGK